MKKKKRTKKTRHKKTRHKKTRHKKTRHKKTACKSRKSRDTQKNLGKGFFNWCCLGRCKSKKFKNKNDITFGKLMKMRLHYSPKTNRRKKITLETYTDLIKTQLYR